MPVWATVADCPRMKEAPGWATDELLAATGMFVGVAPQATLVMVVVGAAGAVALLGIDCPLPQPQAVPPSTPLPVLPIRVSYETVRSVRLIDPRLS